MKKIVVIMVILLFSLSGCKPQTIDECPAGQELVGTECFNFKIYLPGIMEKQASSKKNMKQISQRMLSLP